MADAQHAASQCVSQETFRWLFAAVSVVLGWPMTALQVTLQWLPWPATLGGFTVLAYVAGGVLVAPIGFLAEHVETLYDIDVEAKALAHRLGMTHLERMPAMDTRPRFIEALDAVARPLLRQ